MTEQEQVYALFVEANPYPDVESLPETFEERRVPLHAVGSSQPTRQDEHRAVADTASGVRVAGGRSGRLAVIATALVIVVAMGALVARNLQTSSLPASSDARVDLTHTEQAMEFITRLEEGNVDGAAALLADPIGMIWFIPIGRVSGSGEVLDYLDFYVATGIETEISDCEAQTVGPLTEVTCRASQTAGVLSQLGLTLPLFDMIFSVWDDGIQQIGSRSDDPQQFDAAFNESRFFEFRTTVLRPAGLVKANGDPVWSKQNGELMQELIDDFLSRSS